MRIFVSAFAYIFLLSALAFAEVDLAKANTLLKKGKPFEALKIVSPCLAANTVDSISNLEECLYQGEKIGEIAIETLNTEYQNAVGQKKEIDLSELISPYKEIGVEPKLEKSLRDIRIAYNHDFFKRLINLFPNSKYKGEIEYLFIKLDAHYTKWDVWNQRLVKLIKEYPNDKFIVKAKYDLALNYDDLWDFTNPKHKRWFEEEHLFPQKSKKTSEEYKQKALKLYQEIIRSPYKNILADWQINDVKERLKYLPKSEKKGKRLHIITGYL